MYFLRLKKINVSANISGLRGLPDYGPAPEVDPGSAFDDVSPTFSSESFVFVLF